MATSTAKHDKSIANNTEEEITDPHLHDGFSARSTYDLYCPRRDHLDISRGDVEIYHLAIYDLGREKPALVLHRGASIKDVRLAAGKIQRASKDFSIYLGADENPTKDDWNAIRCISTGSGIGSSSTLFHFTVSDERSKGKAFHWTKTREKELGASKWTGRDLKLVEEDTEDVVAVYLDQMGSHAVGRRGRIVWMRASGERFEAQALIVLFSILERKSRSIRSVLKVMNGGGGVRGVMAA